MARRARGQLSLDGLFETGGPRPGSLDIALELRNALSNAIRSCGLSRAQIAARMTDLIWGDAGDGEITKAQLDAWTAPSRADWRFPLEYLPAFIQATGSIDLLKLLAEKVACFVLPTEQVKVMELAVLNVRRQEILKAERRLKEEVSAEDVKAFLAETQRGRQ